MPAPAQTLGYSVPLFEERLTPSSAMQWSAVGSTVFGVGFSGYLVIAGSWEMGVGPFVVAVVVTGLMLLNRQWLQVYPGELILRRPLRPNRVIQLTQIEDVEVTSWLPRLSLDNATSEGVKIKLSTRFRPVLIRSNRGVELVNLLRGLSGLPISILASEPTPAIALTEVTRVEPHEEIVRPPPMEITEVMFMGLVFLGLAFIFVWSAGILWIRIGIAIYVSWMLFNALVLRPRMRLHIRVDCQGIHASLGRAKLEVPADQIRNAHAVDAPRTATIGAVNRRPDSREEAFVVGHARCIRIVLTDGHGVRLDSMDPEILTQKIIQLRNSTAQSEFSGATQNPPH